MLLSSTIVVVLLLSVLWLVSKKWFYASIMPLFYLASILYLQFGFYIEGQYSDQMFYFDRFASAELIHEAFSLISLSSLFFTFFLVLSSKTNLLSILARLFTKRRSLLPSFISERQYNVRTSHSLLIAWSLLNIILFNLVANPQLLYYRDSYPLGSTASYYLLILLPISLSLNSLFLSTFRNRFTPTLILIVYSIYNLALGTRLAVFPPVLFLIGSYAFHDKGRSNLRNLISTFIVYILIFLTLLLPIYMRQTNLPYGVFGLGRALHSFATNFFQQRYSFLDYLFSYPVFATIASYNINCTSTDLVYYSLSPLPLDLAQKRYLLSFKLPNLVSPCTAFGSLWAYNTFYVFAFYSTAGLMFGILHSYVKRKSKLVSTLLGVILFLFSFLCLSYNLRSSTRLLTLALFAVPFLVALEKIRFRSID